MGSNKTIRDPMYGYIKIDYPFTVLIDTEEFQRLRNIRQTGYQSLYPSALHNRFVHSLGVFHLGREAFHYFSRNVKASLEEEWNSIDNQELLCRGWFLPPNTYDCGSFVVNGTAVVGKEPKKPYNRCKSTQKGADSYEISI